MKDDWENLAKKERPVAQARQECCRVYPCSDLLMLAKTSAKAHLKCLTTMRLGDLSNELSSLNRDAYSEVHVAFDLCSSDQILTEVPDRVPGACRIDG